jgi:glycosyltransferase involved in cell wall biosynthesis
MISLLRGILAAGHSVTLLCSGESFAQAARSAGLSAETLPRPLDRGVGILRAAAVVRRLCGTAGADVLHAEGIRAAMAAWLACLGMRSPPGFVVTVHNITEPGPLSYAIAAVLLRATGPLLTTVSESERARYVDRGFPARRCVTIHNGIALSDPSGPERRRTARAALGLPAKALIVTHVGRLSREKGHLPLLRAVAALPPLAGPVLLLLAGDGPMRTPLELERDRLGLGTRVRFLGQRPDVLTIMHASDLLVLPSLTEAFPMVLLEAMAIGLPVLATRVGGVPELITHGDDGWVVEPGDQQAFQRALLEALSDEEARAARGRAGRARVAGHFTLERMVRETLAAYTRATGSTTVES